MNKEKTDEEKDIEQMTIVLFWPIWLPIVIGFLWAIYWVIFRCQICRA